MLKILIVDDEPEISKALEAFFAQRGYDVLTAADGRHALDMIQEHRPHLVFLDIRMPKMDGLTVLRHIRALDKSIKVIMVTAFGTKEIMTEAARLGAVDFIRKPFTLEYLKHDVIAKVNAQLFEELRQEIEEKNKLIDQLRHLNLRISRNFYQTILSLATALEARDHYTHGHSERVAKYSRMIIDELRQMNHVAADEKFLHDLYVESRLHDIGKIAVSDDILHKPGGLTDEEFDEIKKHPVESARILTPLDGVKDNIEVIYSHHERVDGKGYPGSMSGKKIPLRAKIIAVADAFDAMTSDRPYRAALSVETAVSELEKNKHSQFDYEIVDSFLKVLRKKARLQQHKEAAIKI